MATAALQPSKLSPSSTGDSPHSIGGASSTGRPYPLPSRDSFSIEVPSPQLKPVNGSTLKSPTSAKVQKTSGFSREGILGSAQKARNLSQSSEVRSDPYTTVNGMSKGSSDEGTINPLKRRNTDATVDYPRRRATIACEVCRSRKSRCDGTKPKCKLCTELGAECIYREPGIKLDAGDKLILRETYAHRESSADESGWWCNGTVALTGDNLLAHDANRFVSIIPSGGLGTWTSGTNISTMPKVHTNAALHLLQWPLIRDLVSRPYDPQILLQLEMAREPLPSLAKTPCVDLSNTNAYIEAYFDRVNIWYSCVNPYTWRSHYRSALSNGFREGPESCIVLLVLALGQASLRGSISRIVPHEDPPGLQYFTAAWSLLPGMMTTNSVLAAQCHLLAAAYLFYLVRPLEAWNLLCTTSNKLQLLLMSPNRVPEDQRELLERIYWNALLFESDLLAELDLPHSGVVQLEEHVGLPGGFQGEESEAVGRDDLWYFLAEIALRRLLNRVSQLIYSKDSMASTTSLEPVVAELDFQLTQWYESLPVALQFPFTRTALPDPVQTVLRLRFFACRTIIYRPYILAVLDNEQAIMDPAVRESCHKCLEASIRQLEHIGAHHAGHMPYLWQGALSIVSQTLLVMGATMSPSLSSIILTLLPHREAMDQIINDVIMDIERMAVLAPSLSLAAEIIKEAEVRRRSFLNG
ncbi:C6 finger domain-containing protein [Apiospora phragmitis]|uniref:C6 finger domain-containing protein n=1 Tax=Apiospora phragmitis TaxID=2905665 RepID=A0ABR1X5H0_9PEZI